MGCYVCATNAPSEKSMRIHFEAKHSKMTFELEKCLVNQVKKDKNAMRERIGAGGPSAVCGKGSRQKKKTRSEQKRSAVEPNQRPRAKEKEKENKDVEKRSPS